MDILFTHIDKIGMAGIGADQPRGARADTGKGNIARGADSAVDLDLNTDYSYASPVVAQVSRSDQLAAF